MAGVVKHIFVGFEMVEHLKRLKQRLACGYHAQPLFLQLPCVVDRERVAFNGARMGGEQYLVKLAILFSIHPVYHDCLIFCSQIFVIVDLFLKCHSACLRLFQPKSVIRPFYV